MEQQESKRDSLTVFPEEVVAQAPEQEKATETASETPNEAATAADSASPEETVATLEQQSSGSAGEAPKEATPAEVQTSSEDNALTYPQLEEKIASLTAPEEKIGYYLTFMEQSIAKGASPSFKEFWDARKASLALFKEENLAFGVRAHLWNKYIDLSKEAYKLKEILDEQSAFAIEQIDLAVQALEKDLAAGNLPDRSALPALPSALEKNKATYLSSQEELQKLNAFALRINSLRKELIKTEMRIRQKNQFFKRLSSAGDSIFPRRKELIKELSALFLDDISSYVAKNFSGEKFTKPLFALREEIKALQTAAKELTLNTQAFNQSRMQLSECWDKLKKVEKEFKKERSKEKAELSQNAQPFYDRLKEIEEQEQSDDELLKKLEAVSTEMRDVKLARDDVKKLRGRLQEKRSAIEEKQAAVAKEAAEKARAERLKQREAFQGHLKAIEALGAELATKSIEEVAQELEEKRQQALALQPTKWEVQDLERRVRSVKDQISQAKIQNLPSDAREALEQLRTLQGEAQERRNEVRVQLEMLRKSANASGLDLEQALQQRELVEAEKERLEAIEGEVKEIEQKIQKLQQ